MTPKERNLFAVCKMTCRSNNFRSLSEKHVEEKKVLTCVRSAIVLSVKK